MPLLIESGAILEQVILLTENESKTHNIETKISLVGDVKDKICLILDDMIDNPLTFIDSADHLKKCGAASIHIMAVHGILSSLKFN